VGWQSNNDNPYYIVRGNNGETLGDKGYFKYADNRKNEECMYARQAWRLLVSPRKEIEYKLGQGKLTFPKAMQWCRNLGQGWDLAHIPTEMHNFEVYDLFTERFGREKSKDKSFNFFWIGLFNTNRGKNSKNAKWTWVSDNSNSDVNTVKYIRFDRNNRYKYGVMKKVHTGKDSKRGIWTTKPGFSAYRFVCSRYREESCPRISQTSITNAYKVSFHRPEDGGETLEIVDGTRLSVTCMEGYEKDGDDGVCDAGVWKNLPACSMK